MSTHNNIKLPASLLASLYENVLIDPGTKSTEKPEKQTDKKQTAIICYSPEDFIAPEEKAFLDSILNACKVNKEDVVVMSDKDPVADDHKKIDAAFGPNVVLLFGLAPSAIQLPVHFPEFQIQSFQKTKYMCAPALDSIQGDKALKMQLWKTLQQLYAL